MAKGCEHQNVCSLEISIKIYTIVTQRVMDRAKMNSGLSDSKGYDVTTVKCLLSHYMVLFSL